MQKFEIFHSQNWPNLRRMKTRAVSFNTEMKLFNQISKNFFMNHFVKYSLTKHNFKNYFDTRNTENYLPKYKK